jgi:hypothetical protein
MPKRAKTIRRDNKYQKRQENKEKGSLFSFKECKGMEDSRIKIEAELRIMRKRATLTRSTMQDQDRNPRKEEHEAKLKDKDKNLK